MSEVKRKIHLTTHSSDKRTYYICVNTLYCLYYALTSFYLIPSLQLHNEIEINNLEIPWIKYTAKNPTVYVRQYSKPQFPSPGPLYNETYHKTQEG